MLAAAEDQLANRDSEVSVGNRGVYVEIYTLRDWFQPEFFERKDEGIVIASVTPFDEETLRVTLFVPETAFDFYRTALHKYRTEMSRRGVNPKNAARIERIEDLRLGSLTSLWSDSRAPFPTEPGELWWEVWLFADKAEHFVDVAHSFDIDVKPGSISYPDVVVRIARGTRESLERLVQHTDAVAELRRPANASIVTRLEKITEVALLQDAGDRIEPAPEGAVRLCVLDSGLNNGHPLLVNVIPDENVHTWNSSWGSQDDENHGTPMATLALWGDLAPDLAQTSLLQTVNEFESVKIYSENHDGAPEPELYGAVIEDSVHIVESVAPHKRRIFFSATTDSLNDNDGLPSEWSASLDAMSAQAGHQRLFLISAGNADAGACDPKHYPVYNTLCPIFDPAQAWNVITVGGYTERDEPLSGALSGYQPLAPRGGLSPWSRTAINWKRQGAAVPNKPDIVVEAGNYAYAPGDQIASSADDYHMIAADAEYRRGAALCWFGATSGATAVAAGLAGKLAEQFRDLWPETVRALLVHSARWSEYMTHELALANTEQDRLNFLRRFGHGVPNLARASYSALNDATMVIQGTMKPYARIDSDVKTNELVRYDLPWPVEFLEDLGNTRVELRVTLSYFVEPNPSRRGFRGKYSYPSYGLRFAVKRPDESASQFMQRINAAEQNDEYQEARGFDQWTLGRIRDRGSLHSDIWVGKAIDLAQSGIIGVYPTSGWWRYRRTRERVWDRDARYALVVSLSTQDSNIDIYGAIETEIAAHVGVEIETE